MKPDLNSKNYTTASVIICIISFAYYFLPLFILGENSHVRIHDCLDSDYVYRILLVRTHTAFILNPFYPINNVMNGLPRACLPSGINIYVLITYLIPNFYGYVVNLVIIRLTGLFGMYYFLKNWVLLAPPFGGQGGYKPLNIMVSTAFSLLPIFAFTGIATLGIPMLANALLKIKNGAKSYKYYIPFIVYPLYCYNNMIPLIIGLTLLAIIYFTLQTKKINYRLLLAFALLLITFLVSEFQLLYVFLFHKFSLNRAAIHTITTLNYKGVVGVAFLTILHGVYHSANYPLALYLFCAIFIAVGLYFKEDMKQLRIIFLLLLATGVCYAGFDWFGLQALYAKYGFLDEFSLKRIHYVLPFLSYLFLAVSISLIDKRLTWIKFIIFPILLLLTFQLNWKFDRSNEPYTYKQYFSASLFNKIANDIGMDKQSYRVCNVGLSPSIAQYNGFYTLDSYYNVYPLLYKYSFRKIIAGELNKDKDLEYMFDSTAGSNRLYIYSSELFENRFTNGTIQNLDLNHRALKQLNCKYIFSEFEINSFSTDSIVFDKKYVDSSSPYTIYLYKIL